jgi:hypothetical protein
MHHQPDSKPTPTLHDITTTSLLFTTLQNLPANRLATEGGQTEPGNTDEHPAAKLPPHTLYSTSYLSAHVVMQATHSATVAAVTFTRHTTRTFCQACWNTNSDPAAAAAAAGKRLLLTLLLTPPLPLPGKQLLTIHTCCCCCCCCRRCCCLRHSQLLLPPQVAAAAAGAAAAIGIPGCCRSTSRFLITAPAGSTGPPTGAPMPMLRPMPAPCAPRFCP